MAIGNTCFAANVFHLQVLRRRYLKNPQSPTAEKLECTLEGKSLSRDYQDVLVSRTY